MRMFNTLNGLKKTQSDQEPCWYATSYFYDMLTNQKKFDTSNEKTEAIQKWVYNSLGNRKIPKRIIMPININQVTGYLLILI